MHRKSNDEVALSLSAPILLQITVFSIDFLVGQRTPSTPRISDSAVDSMGRVKKARDKNTSRLRLGRPLLANVPSTSSSTVSSITYMTNDKTRVWNLLACTACLSPDNLTSPWRPGRATWCNSSDASTCEVRNQQNTDEIGLELEYEDEYHRTVHLNDPYPFDRS